MAINVDNLIQKGRDTIDDAVVKTNSVSNFIKEHINEYLIIPKDDGGSMPLKMDIVGEETLSFSSDVTDHYVESNEAYQDQISLKPKIYTVSGEIGELCWYQKSSAQQTVGQVAQKLEGVVSFLPTMSKGFQQMKKTVMKAAQWVDTADNILTRFTSVIEEPLATSRQSAEYRYLLMLRDLRSPIDVQTPWGILQNYVITDCKITQPKNTKDKSQISISFKEFRVTRIGPAVAFNASKYQGNAAFERQPNTDNGTTAGTDKSISEPANSTEIGKMLSLEQKRDFSDGSYLAEVSDGTNKAFVDFSRETGDTIVSDSTGHILEGQSRQNVIDFMAQYDIKEAIGK